MMQRLIAAILCLVMIPSAVALDYEELQQIVLKDLCNGMFINLGRRLPIFSNSTGANFDDLDEDLETIIGQIRQSRTDYERILSNPEALAQGDTAPWFVKLFVLWRQNPYEELIEGRSENAQIKMQLGTRALALHDQIEEMRSRLERRALKEGYDELTLDWTIARYTKLTMDVFSSLSITDDGEIEENGSYLAANAMLEELENDIAAFKTYFDQGNASFLANPLLEKFSRAVVRAKFKQLSSYFETEPSIAVKRRLFALTRRYRVSIDELLTRYNEIDNHSDLNLDDMHRLMIVQVSLERDQTIRSVVRRVSGIYNQNRSFFAGEYSLLAVMADISFEKGRNAEQTYRLYREIEDELGGQSLSLNRGGIVYLSKLISDDFPVARLARLVRSAADEIEDRYKNELGYVGLVVLVENAMVANPRIPSVSEQVKRFHETRNAVRSIWPSIPDSDIAHIARFCYESGVTPNQMRTTLQRVDEIRGEPLGLMRQLSIVAIALKKRYGAIDTERSGVTSRQILSDQDISMAMLIPFLRITVSTDQFRDREYVPPRPKPVRSAYWSSNVRPSRRSTAVSSRSTIVEDDEDDENSFGTFGFSVGTHGVKPEMRMGGSMYMDMTDGSLGFDLGGGMTWDMDDGFGFKFG